MKWMAYAGALLLALLVAVVSEVPAIAQEQKQPGFQEQIVTVSIQDFAFEPTRLTVEPGTTVEWVNKGKTSHTVDSTDDGPLSSKTLQPGEAYRFTFQEPDVTREYYCDFHPDKMTGSVVVRVAGADVKQFGTEIPDTGGPSLMLLASLALIASGCAGFILVFRSVGNKISHLK